MQWHHLVLPGLFAIKINFHPLFSRVVLYRPVPGLPVCTPCGSVELVDCQMSNTYTNIQEDVEGVFALARARIIAQLQRRKWMLCKELRDQC